MLGGSLPFVFRFSLLVRLDNSYSSHFKFTIWFFCHFILLLNASFEFHLKFFTGFFSAYVSFWVFFNIFHFFCKISVPLLGLSNFPFALGCWQLFIEILLHWLFKNTCIVILTSASSCFFYICWLSFLNQNLFVIVLDTTNDI